MIKTQTNNLKFFGCRIELSLSNKIARLFQDIPKISKKNLSAGQHQMGIKPTTSRVYSHTLCPAPQLASNLLDKYYEREC